MSGHSKWSKIKRQKQSGDLKRGQEFTKIGRAITLAVKEGGGVVDPASNFKLRIAIDKAKGINMPKDNIDRAIERGTGKSGEGSTIEQVVYEGYGPYGVALLIEAATDNKQRTGAQIKHALERAGGNLSNPGSVVFLFNQQGLIIVSQSGMTDDAMLDCAIECGATDVEPTEDEFEIYTERNKLHEVTDALKDKGLTVLDSELIYRPISKVPLDDPKHTQQLIALFEALEDLEDVQHIHSNADM